MLVIDKASFTQIYTYKMRFVSLCNFVHSETDTQLCWFSVFFVANKLFSERLNKITYVTFSDS